MKELELTSVFFLLKASQPCRDWLGVRTGDHSTSDVSKHWGIRCGYNPNDSVFRGSRIELRFQSDSRHQEMGFWMQLKCKYTSLIITQAQHCH